MHSVEKACFRASIHSGARPKRSGSSDAECVQSEPPPKPPFSQEKKPTQEEKEQAQAQESERKRASNEAMNTVEESRYEAVIQSEARPKRKGSSDA
jgi:hypothetical protein